MYRIYLDNELLYSPELDPSEYGITEATCDMSLNAAGSLEFTMPPTHVLYNSINRMKSNVELRVTDDGVTEETIWIGRVLHDEKDFFNSKQVYCEGEFSFFNDSIIRPIGTSSSSSSDSGDSSSGPKAPISILFAFYILQHNTQVESDRRFETTIVVDVRDYVQYIYQYYPAYVSPWLKKNNIILGGTIGTVISTMGTSAYSYYTSSILGKQGTWIKAHVYDNHLDLDFDTTHLPIGCNVHATDGNTVDIDLSGYQTTQAKLEDMVSNHEGYMKVFNRHIEYLTVPGVLDDQVIEFGESIIDYTEKIDASEVFTVLIPLGKNDMTIAKANKDGKDYIESKAGIKVFGRITQTKKWENVSNVATLLALGIGYLELQLGMALDMTLTAVDLHDLNVDVSRLKLGNRYLVRDSAHGNNGAEYTLNEITIDLQQPDSSEYHFGVDFKALTDAEIAKGKTQTEKERLADQVVEFRAALYDDIKGYDQHIVKSIAAVIKPDSGVPVIALNGGENLDYYIPVVGSPKIYTATATEASTIVSAPFFGASFMMVCMHTGQYRIQAAFMMNSDTLVNYRYYSTTGWSSWKQVTSISSITI